MSSIYWQLKEITKAAHLPPVKLSLRRSLSVVIAAAMPLLQTGSLSAYAADASANSSSGTATTTNSKTDKAKSASPAPTKGTHATDNDSAPPPSPDPLGLKPLAPKAAPIPDVNPAAPSTSTAPTSNQTKATAAAGNKATAAAGNKAAAAAPPTAPAIDKLKQLSELEKIMFGAPQPNIPIEYRLDRLESETFHQTNPEWDAQRRIDRLSRTLIGGNAGTTAAGSTPPVPPGSQMQAPTYNTGNNPYLPPLPSVPNMPLDGGAPPATASQPNYLPTPADIGSPSFKKEMSRQQLEQYAMELINDARSESGLAPLSWDDLAYKVSKDQVADLCKRNTSDHTNAAGDNPDVRYTKAGGTDCLVESLVAVKLKGRPIPNKELVYNILKELTSHQDDRDALLNSHATNFAFTFDISANNEKIIACAETVTKQAAVEAIPAEVHVGDKLDIKGTLTGPYKFQKITIAWEGLTTPPADEDSTDDAAPYFPPLDYEAFARHSEHDFAKAQKWLAIGGIGLAIAGGLFIPPVALAAPLIAATTSNVKPKAISEIPVHGGVHSDGTSFEFKAPISKENKEGIYYITVWAQSEVDQAPFAVSRRAVVARSPLTVTPTAEATTSKEQSVVITDAKKSKANDK